MSQMPLAALLRPTNLDDVCGQQHLLSHDSVFRRAIENGVVSNMLFYGPSGVGKTTVATIIAKMSNKKLFKLNGTQSSISDIREVISSANLSPGEDGVLLYLDEIQYLNKKQQQSLLEVLEDGTVTMIASTTENPYFSVFSAILSRSTIFEFKPLTPADVKYGLERAVKNYNSLTENNVSLDDEAFSALASGCGGDMRKAFNSLELLLASVQGMDNPTITLREAKQVVQRSSNRFDNSGDEHYNLLSALQKSIRGSDENAALHYLARLLDGDGMLPAIRRILVCACEDVGLAHPQAIITAKTCCDIALQTGMPEARIPLGCAVVMLCTSPKSNSAYNAINAAMEDVRMGGFGDIPTKLKDSNNPGRKALSAEETYQYPHDFPYHYVKQQYLPDAIKEKVYYEYGENRAEQAAKAYWGKIK